MDELTRLRRLSVVARLLYRALCKDRSDAFEDRSPIKHQIPHEIWNAFERALVDECSTGHEPSCTPPSAELLSCVR